MTSRTSRGVLEWSGGKDLYMESCCSGSGKSSIFFGIVPGSFRKVPEDSGGVRRSGKCSTTSNTAAWALGGLVPLAHIGQGAPPTAHVAPRGRWPHPVGPRDPSGGPGTIPMTPKLVPMAETGLPIYKSLPPDHSGTPRDVRDLIRDSEQHSVTTYKLPL